jgi:hypothetical protein
MKNIFTLITLFASTTLLFGQEQNAFEEAFDGMFEVGEPEWVVPMNTGNPPPPVPVDGGLVALLAAGGAVGYRKYKSRQSSRQND